MRRRTTTKPFSSRDQMRKCFALAREARSRGMKPKWNCAEWAKSTDMSRLKTKDYHSGIIIALYPDLSSASVIHDLALKTFGDNSESVDDLHLTLKYIGTVDQGLCLDCALEAVLELAVQSNGHPITAKANGIGRFSGDDEKDAVVLLTDSPEIESLHNQLCNILTLLGLDSESQHGFTPHVTLSYHNSDTATPNIQFSPFQITFNRLSLCWGDTHIDVMLDNPKEDNTMNVSAKAVWDTAYVNNLPDSCFLYIESGGKKDADGKTVPRSKRHFPYKNADGSIDLPHLRNAIARIPQSNAPGLNKDALQKRAQSMLRREHKSRYSRIKNVRSMIGMPEKKIFDQIKSNKLPKILTPGDKQVSGKSSLTVFKQKNGKLRWVLFSSNPYQDSDGEFVTQIAHEQDIAQLDVTGDYGPLRWWHIGEPYFENDRDWTTVKSGPGADLGICDFAAMHGRIRVESGTFKSERIGNAIAQCADGLEGSQGFSHPEGEPDSNGGFLHIKSFERSLTPSGEASNFFTSFLVSNKESGMNSNKLRALKALGVDVDEVLEGAENLQTKADKSGTAFRMKSQSNGTGDDDDQDDVSSKLDALTAQLASLKEAMKEGDTLEPEERLEDMMVAELTVGELQDVISSAITQKSAQPIGIVLKEILDAQEEIKELLTSKSVQSVVDEVSRMKAKLERTQARLKATASKVRELDDVQPRQFQRGVRPSESDDTLLDLDDEGDASLSQKSNNQNPFGWLDDFVSKG